LKGELQPDCDGDACHSGCNCMRAECNNNNDGNLSQLMDGWVDDERAERQARAGVAAVQKAWGRVLEEL
jgi:hypothetical protein